MGSGAFLVATCRYPRCAAERSLIQEGRWHPGEIGIRPSQSAPRDRTAVCSASTSIQWLCSSPGCHFGSQRSHQTSHLPFSTIAWSPGIVSSEPVSTTCGVSRHAATGDIGARVVTAVYGFHSVAHIEHAVRTRLQLALQPDDSPAVVAEKAETLATLHAPESPLGRWSAMLDLWCRLVLGGRTPPSTAVFGELCDRLLHRPAALPDRLTQLSTTRPHWRRGTASSTGRWHSLKCFRTSRETSSRLTPCRQSPVGHVAR